jgi:hypothetical protein
MAQSAFFADKRHTFLIARIYESLMEDAVAITVRAFHERELAAHWLSFVRQRTDRVSECNCYQLFAVSKRSQLYRGR